LPGERFSAIIFVYGGINMKKAKQILAIIGALLLVGLYLTTLILAITDNSGTMKAFFASIVATVVIPVLIWAYTLIYRLVTKKDSER
jgi:hypothetical protein